MMNLFPQLTNIFGDLKGLVFNIARYCESLTKAGEYRKIDKFSKSNHCFTEITSSTWKFCNELYWEKMFFPINWKEPKQKCRLRNNRFSFSFIIATGVLKKHFFPTTIKLSVLRCLVSLTIIAFVYNTAIQHAAPFTCYGYHIMFCVEFAPIYLSLFMLLDCFTIDSKIFIICSPVKKPLNLARQAFLRYRRNRHCRQARRFDCVLVVTCQKLKCHVQGNRLKAIRRMNASQVSLTFIFKTLSSETLLSFQFSMFFNGKVKK